MGERNIGQTQYMLQSKLILIIGNDKSYWQYFFNLEFIFGARKNAAKRTVWAVSNHEAYLLWRQSSAARPLATAIRAGLFAVTYQSNAARSLAAGKKTVWAVANHEAYLMWRRSAAAIRTAGLWATTRLIGCDHTPPFLRCINRTTFPFSLTQTRTLLFFQL